MRALVFALALAALAAACGGDNEPAATQPTSPGNEPPVAATEQQTTAGGVVIPNVPPATGIDLPEGFTAYAITTGYFRPTSIALGEDGTIYISERHGTVYSLSADGALVTFADGFEEVTGLLTTEDGAIYISSRGRITLARDTDGDARADEMEDIIAGLPNGRHQNNGLVLGPDGLLYLTNGSTCDDCAEADELSGTILQANADGSDLRVYASGLRNPYDLVFDARGRLWATDNGSDAPCETVDELDLIVEGEDYGWPYSEDGCDPFADGIAPSASLGLHTAATGIDYYESAHFPPEYQGDLFLTLWGSFFADPELEPQLMRAVLQEGATAGGAPQAGVETFATGFQHPIDVLVDRDGTLLVLDYGTGGERDTDGIVYRIIYTGG